VHPAGGVSYDMAHSRMAAGYFAEMRQTSRSSAGTSLTGQWSRLIILVDSSMVTFMYLPTHLTNILNNLGFTIRRKVVPGSGYPEVVFHCSK